MTLVPSGCDRNVVIKTETTVIGTSVYTPTDGLQDLAAGYV